MKKQIFSIIMIIAILGIVAGIYILKNNDREQNSLPIEETTAEKSQLELQQVDFKLEITDKLDIEALKSYNLPIILDFGSEGCGPCREMAPTLKETNEKMQGKAFIKFMDVWKHPNLANEFPLELIPTQFFINSNGTPLEPEKVSEVKLQKVTDKEGNHLYTRHIGGLTVEQFEYILEGMGVNE